MRSIAWSIVALAGAVVLAAAYHARPDWNFEDHAFGAIVMVIGIAGVFRWWYAGSDD